MFGKQNTIKRLLLLVILEILLNWIQLKVEALFTIIKTGTRAVPLYKSFWLEFTLIKLVRVCCILAVLAFAIKYYQYESIHPECTSTVVEAENKCFLLAFPVTDSPLFLLHSNACCVVLEFLFFTHHFAPDATFFSLFCRFNRNAISTSLLALIRWTRSL